MNDKAATPQLGLIELCLGTDGDGDEAFLYINVRSDCYEEYKRISTSGEPFEPEDYGAIIAQGKGSPTAALVNEIQSKYKFWDGFEEKVTAFGNEILKQRTK